MTGCGVPGEPAAPPALPGGAGAPGVPSTAGPGPAPAPAGPPLRAAAGGCGVSIEEIAVYQVVKVPLVQHGEEVRARNAEIVQGRAALLRVFAIVEAGASPREVIAELAVTAAGRPWTRRERKVLAGGAKEGDLGTTFNFELEPEDVRADARYAVTLGGGDCPSPARYPELGEAPLRPRATGKLKIRLVPIRYGADRSQRLPEVSEGHLKKIQAAVLAVFPVEAVELTVREPVTTMISLASGLDPWGDLLEAVRELRLRDRAPDDVYYYGLVSPAESVQGHCKAGCYLGRSYRPSHPFPEFQVAVGIGFAGEDTIATLLHELGHTHGRLHAPCGTAGYLDPAFPYRDAEIGSWGYDHRAKQLHPPSGAKDMMSYCGPRWVSDYTFRGLLAWVEAVNGAAPRSFLREEQDERDWRALRVDAGGASRWGFALGSEEGPAGDAEWATVLDEAGRPLGRVQVFRTAFGDGPGATVFVPAPEPGWHAVKLDDAPAVPFAGGAAVPPLE